MSVAAQGSVEDIQFRVNKNETKLVRNRKQAMNWKRSICSRMSYLSFMLYTNFNSPYFGILLGQN